MCQSVSFLRAQDHLRGIFSVVIRETEWNLASCDIYKLVGSGESFTSLRRAYSSINHKYYYYLFCSFLFVRIKRSEQS